MTSARCQLASVDIPRETGQVAVVKDEKVLVVQFSALAKKQRTPKKVVLMNRSNTKKLKEETYEELVIIRSGSRAKEQHLDRLQKCGRVRNNGMMYD